MGGEASMGMIGSHSRSGQGLFLFSPQNAQLVSWTSLRSPPLAL